MENDIVYHIPFCNKQELLYVVFFMIISSYMSCYWNYSIFPLFSVLLPWYSIRFPCFNISRVTNKVSYK